MKIERKHIIDASEPDEQGKYQYYYEYDLYYFRSEHLALVARSYIDTASRAAFLGMEENNENRFLTEDDFALPFVKEAIAHLQTEGKSDLAWLTQSGYEPIPQ